MAVITLCKNKVKVPAGRIEFTSSQTWTVPRGVKKVRIFLVGGGGAGGYGDTYSTGNSDYREGFSVGGGGGGGGYTASYFNIPVTPLGTNEIIVGKGGIAGGRYQTPEARKGGTSYFNTYFAEGGFGGEGEYASTTMRGGNGGNGGSGGGGGGFQYSVTIYGDKDIMLNYPNGASGINGSNGATVANSSPHSGGKGGTGQGTTTREFGKPDGKLYSSAGVHLGSSITNTGNGGRGEATGTNGYGKSGDDGIVIVEWDAQ